MTVENNLNKLIEGFNKGRVGFHETTGFVVLNKKGKRGPKGTERSMEKIHERIAAFVKDHPELIGSRKFIELETAISKRGAHLDYRVNHSFWRFFMWKSTKRKIRGSIDKLEAIRQVVLGRTSPKETKGSTDTATSSGKKVRFAGGVALPGMAASLTKSASADVALPGMAASLTKSASADVALPGIPPSREERPTVSASADAALPTSKVSSSTGQSSGASVSALPALGAPPPPPPPPGALGLSPRKPQLQDKLPGMPPHPEGLEKHFPILAKTKAERMGEIAAIEAYLTVVREELPKMEDIVAAYDEATIQLGAARTDMESFVAEKKGIEDLLAVLKRGEEAGEPVELTHTSGSQDSTVTFYPREEMDRINNALAALKAAGKPADAPISEELLITTQIERATAVLEAIEGEIFESREKIGAHRAELDEITGRVPEGLELTAAPNATFRKAIEKKQDELRIWNRGLANRKKELKGLDAKRPVARAVSAPASVMQAAAKGKKKGKKKKISRKEAKKLRKLKEARAIVHEFVQRKSKVGHAALLALSTSSVDGRSFLRHLRPSHQS